MTKRPNEERRPAGNIAVAGAVGEVVALSTTGQLSSVVKERRVGDQLRGPRQRHLPRPRDHAGGHAALGLGLPRVSARPGVGRW
jgi:hypothetical protein